MSVGFIQGFLAGQLTVWILVALFLKCFIFSDANQASLTSRLYQQLPKTSTFHRPKGSLTHLLSKVYGNLATHPAESLDWFNVLIAQVIIQFRNDLHFKEALLMYMDEMLNGEHKPKFLGSIKVIDINLGEEFPIFSNCRIVSRTERIQRLVSRKICFFLFDNELKNN
ncbi:hypothetical protein PCK1_000533 [Pneumocystis canis]|nr:hypothetical protein PCK1_000533 [Pneumocystis canis]